MTLKKAVAAMMGLVLQAGVALAQGAGAPVPQIEILTWPAARYQHYYEASNSVAEGWRQLGLRVRLDPQPFPNPMLGRWFRERNFDAVLSVLTGTTQRMEPDFFTNGQFNTARGAPGDFNVGSFSNAEFDRLGAEQLATYDPAARRTTVFAMQRVLADEQPEAIIGYLVNTFAINTTNLEIPGYEENMDGPRSVWNILRATTRNGTAVRIGRTIDQTTFNPLAATINEDLGMLSLVYDRLVEVGTDGQPRLWLAEALDVTSPTSITVRIRQGHTFNDGQPVTAEDVKFSFDFLKRWEAVGFRAALQSLASVDVVDSHTVRFTLSRPFAPFVLNTLGHVVILPRHVWQDVVERNGLQRPQEYRNQPLVGSGTYVLQHWREGQEISLRRRPGHFNQAASDVLVIVFGSAEVVGQALRRGEIDMSWQPIVPTAVPEFAAARNVRVLRVPSNGYMSIRYNIARPVFADRALRRALAHAIDYDTIIRDVLGDDAGRSATPIVPINAYWHNASIEVPRYDLARARAILREAGYSWGSDGLLRMPAR